MGKKYFTTQELSKSYAAKRLGIINIPNEEQTKNLEDLIDVCLDPIRIFFPGKILVYSGFRSQELNEALKKSPNSLHMQGLECDIRPSSGTEEDIQKLFNLAKQVNFDSLILKRKFTNTHKVWFSYISISYNPVQCERRVIENLILNPKFVLKRYKDDFEFKTYYLPPF